MNPITHQQQADVVAANRSQIESEVDTFTPIRYAQMVAHLPSHATNVLDVGCNTGRGGRAMKRARPTLQIIGVDCVPERISALDKTVYQDALCALASELPLADGSLDGIVAGEFIEHVPPAQIEATLLEFFRVLRLKGRLVLTTPNPNYLKNKLRHLSVLTERSHLSQHYADCLAWRLRTIGFSHIKTFGSGRCSRFLGQRFPVRCLYGSYLIQADKW